MTYSVSGLPGSLTIGSSTGLISGTPSTSVSPGIYPTTLTVTDGTATEKLTFNWIVYPATLVTLTNPGTQSGTEGNTVSLSIGATDSSSGTLKYSALGLPTGLKINPTTGAITGTVARGAWANGPYSVTVIAQDGTYLTSQTFTWTINSPIAITPRADQSNTDGNIVSLSLSATGNKRGRESLFCTIQT